MTDAVHITQALLLEKHTSQAPGGGFLLLDDPLDNFLSLFFQLASKCLTRGRFIGGTIGSSWMSQNAPSLLVSDTSICSTISRHLYNSNSRAKFSPALRRNFSFKDVCILITAMFTFPLYVSCVSIVYSMTHGDACWAVRLFVFMKKQHTCRVNHYTIMFSLLRSHYLDCSLFCACISLENHRPNKGRWT